MKCQILWLQRLHIATVYLIYHVNEVNHECWFKQIYTAHVFSNFKVYLIKYCMCIWSIIDKKWKKRSINKKNKKTAHKCSASSINERFFNHHLFHLLFDKVEIAMTHLTVTSLTSTNIFLYYINTVHTNYGNWTLWREMIKLSLRTLSTMLFRKISFSTAGADRGAYW